MKPRNIPHAATAAFALILLLAASCSDDTVSDGSYIHVTIRSPAPDTLLTAFPVRITTEVEASCGCQRLVEFRIDDSLHYTDYAGPFEYLWKTPPLPGTHKIHVKAHLVGKALGYDSIYVRTQ